MPDEGTLVEAWRGGDKSAGAQLFDRHYPSVARFFRNKVGAHSSDLIQATFLACFEGLDRMRSTNFRSYLFAIACNLLRKHYRSNSRARIDFGTVSVHDLDPSPSAVIVANAQHQQLLTALRRIPLDSQVVLELFYWESMTAVEIGETLDIPVGTAKTRIRRARQLLQQQMTALDRDGVGSQCTLEDLDAWASQLRGQLRSA